MYRVYFDDKDTSKTIFEILEAADTKWMVSSKKTKTTAEEARTVRVFLSFSPAFSERIQNWSTFSLIPTIESSQNREEKKRRLLRVALTAKKEKEIPI